MGPKQLWRLLQKTAQAWAEDKASRLAAAVAYYTVFSLTPMVTIALAVAGAVFGEDAARGSLVGQMQKLVGRQSAQAIETAIANIGYSSHSGLASILNIIVLLFAASGVFTELQDALNTIWNVAPKPNSGIRLFIRQRFLAFLMVFGIGLLLLASLMLNTILVAITPLVGSVLPMNLAPWQLLNTVGTFAIFTLLFALIYKFLPDTRIAWGDVWVGALITATLFSIGKWALGYYLGHSSFSSAFGAAGSLVFIVAWVFYSAQILFFGAEFTQVYATEYGSYIRPRKGAIALAKPEQMPQAIAHSGRLKKSEQVDVERSIAVQAKLASVPRLRQLGVSAAEIAEALEVPLVEVEQVLQRVQ